MTKPKGIIGVVYGGGHVSSFGAGTLGILKQAGDRYNVLGFWDGYKGLDDGRFEPLKEDMINPDAAGTALGSPRGKVDAGKVSHVIKKLGMCALIVEGGDDHMGEARRLYEAGVPVVGWPKTMDNDLSGTCFTLGYPTAVDVGSRIVRCAHTGAITNKKVYAFVLFGRDTDWVTAGVGKWGGADFVVPGEAEYDWRRITEKMQTVYEENGRKYGKPFAVVAVSEGAKIKGLESHVRADEVDAHGNTKLDPIKLALLLKDAAPLNLQKIMITQPVTYMMRDSPPTVADKKYADEAGRECVKMVERGQFGSAAVFHRNDEGFEVSTETLGVVSQKRHVRPEGWIDYENMTVEPRFGKYMEPLFGTPPEMDEIVFGAFPLLRKVRRKTK
jgi:6-phosphofructokinase 1